MKWFTKAGSRGLPGIAGHVEQCDQVAQLVRTLPNVGGAVDFLLIEEGDEFALREGGGGRRQGAFGMK